MKSFGEYHPPETVGIHFNRFAIPHGNRLPPAPVQGELFHLDTDIDGENQRPSFSRGLYISPGFGWTKFHDQFAKRKAVSIGAQRIDIEQPVDIYEVPLAHEGFALASTVIHSEHRCSISGNASFWTSVDVDGFVIASIFRGETLVAFAVEELPAEKCRTMSLSFVDAPPTIGSHVYTLKVNTTAGRLFINKSTTLGYNGQSQTAFIVAENN